MTIERRLEDPDEYAEWLHEMWTSGNEQLIVGCARRVLGWTPDDRRQNMWAVLHMTWMVLAEDETVRLDWDSFRAAVARRRQLSALNAMPRLSSSSTQQFQWLESSQPQWNCEPVTE